MQGVTEFAPVSSSGHLVLVPWLLGWPSPSLSFAAILHLGTLLAVVSYFLGDLRTLAREWFMSLRERSLQGSPYRKLAWGLLLGTLPGAFTGWLLEDFLASLFQAPLYAAGFLVLTGSALFLAERTENAHRKLSQIGFADSLLIGLGQACALAPGLSRSGLTIATGLWRGLGRQAAARFSFLLAAPIVLGSGALGLYRLASHPTSYEPPQALLLGFLGAAASGYLTIRYLLSYLRRGKFFPFALYCLLVGLALTVGTILSGCGSDVEVSPSPPTPLRVGTVPGTEKLMDELRQAYHETGGLHPVQISSLRSRAALEELGQGLLDLAVVDREPRAEDVAELQMALLGRDAVALVVHPANPIASLSLEEVQKVFSGEVLGWGALGGEPQEIEVLSREEGAELRQNFEELAMGKKAVTRAARVLPDSQAMLKWVSRHPAAIGYVALGELSPSVKALAIDGVLSTPESLTEESYLLSYRLILILGKEPSQAAMDFARFILSPPGQDALGKTYGRAR